MDDPITKLRNKLSIKLREELEKMDAITESKGKMQPGQPNEPQQALQEEDETKVLITFGGYIPLLDALKETLISAGYDIKSIEFTYKKCENTPYLGF